MTRPAEDEPEIVLSGNSLAAPVVTTNWVDDRDPPIKIGYDEKEQRLTFDGNNSKLGIGTGIGMSSFTAYSAALDAGQSDLGIPAFGNNKDIIADPFFLTAVGVLFPYTYT